MTQSNEPNDYDRQLRYINRRIERLEDTQITPQEFGRAFERVHTELSQIKTDIRDLSERVEAINQDLSSKIDIILRHVTGQGDR